MTAASAPAAPTQDDDLDPLAEKAHDLRRDPGSIIDRLRDLRTHPDGHAAMLAQSYWHANGFAKVRIGQRHGVQTRLHIWPKGEGRLGDIDPHGHRWAFASWIAVGAGLTETYYNATDPGGDGARMYARYEYGRGADGEGYLEPLGDAWLRESTTFERRNGAIYDCRPPVLHTVAPLGDDLLVTVVIQGPVTERSAPVYSLPRRPHEVVQDPIPVPHLARLFEQVEQALAR
jgi:hypothetical protein